MYIYILEYFQSSMIEKDIHKDYKKEAPKNVQKVNQAHKKIIKNLGIQDRVFKTTERESFITLKDHKGDFNTNPKCRLLNPTKCEIGRISHQNLARIVTNVRKNSGLKSHWKNTYSCIEWFKEIKDKKSKPFIVFDIVSFYPTISQELLTKALNWAKEFTEISEEEMNIVFEARKSFLIFEGNYWSKKQSPEFDVPMGSYDGAEVCDIVGLFILSKLEKLEENVNLGCYKDDCLAVCNLSAQKTEGFKKKICQTFKTFGLSITIEAVNTKIVQFLDVELNLENETFKPYLKPGDTPLYVHSKSNHPPSVKKNIPEAINRRLSSLSSDENQFNSVAPTYQQALEKAGYKFKLQFKPQQAKNPAKNRNRKRQVLWWNPPFSENVKTPIGRIFFKLLDQHFPKDHPLHKILNRNTVKMSYRTTPNMKKIISAHNSKILKPEKSNPPATAEKRKPAHLRGNAGLTTWCTKQLSQQIPSPPNSGNLHWDDLHPIQS